MSQSKLLSQSILKSTVTVILTCQSWEVGDVVVPEGKESLAVDDGDDAQLQDLVARLRMVTIPTIRPNIFQL